MGGSSTKVPPTSEKDLRTVLSYNLTEAHIKQLYKIFQEVDVDKNGVWSVSEMYNVLKEPRLSVRAPVIDTIFFMGNSNSEGSLSFPDFLVTMCSFCALSKEEMLQFLFMIIDVDRNGNIEKEELLSFFSYIPAGLGEGSNEPVFPVNNKNAVDKFRGGKWLSLQFDGLAQLCERFPYIAYPAFHTQEMYRALILGASFWEKLDYERIKYQTVIRTKRVRQPFTKKKIEVKLPGRVTMQELLEYSRRKTAVQGGKRVSAQQDSAEDSPLAKERDQQIQRSPILNMIRNPRCMYYVPLEGTQKYQNKAKNQRSELDVGENDFTGTGADDDLGVSTGAPNNANQMLAMVSEMQSKTAQDSDSGSDSDDSDDMIEEGEEEDGEEDEVAD
mmetsp:Transcript_16520/g.28884  ORF Transcript_16520/g.28884 Transcript_16520/m.28884 type:complete len:386 (-) Transcript_16520:70-1227(-)|eukprot:CAMPEP_0197661306 /NCGR_PEP_ID=MMETSP1338-20131121/51375_1 /TAXON_ID=43686 ORGANISM="Pelagodinium beii, Strain RCC1491" /NCGR_SAMPLE_ID=MMETSP1338 /ASSEMBLY_ACC=CAM_ASM_000754 /LENGTH=385 /DNA_ID=CAMNT_0043238841 /DNA_START=57 /DNA_END=1214 /DNA_ORIENTATION=-